MRGNPVIIAANLGDYTYICSCGSAGKESACKAGDLGSIPGLGRSPGEGKVYPLQYSGLENPMDYTIRGLQRVGHDFHFHFRPCYTAII